MGTSTPAYLKYRPEIDGLRACAVAGVVLFHAHVPGFPGGYVGVDVFFVISGYLITQIILRDLELGAFSFVKFYERRIRRILPALLVVLAFTTSVSLILLPYDLKQYSKSLAAVPAFVSNFIFWLGSDYFGSGVINVPLLHTWSLAIEEQFYIVFPIVLIFLAKRGRAFLIMGIVTLAGVSLALCIWETARDQRSGFYMPYSRAWELMIGAYLAANVNAPSRLVGNLAGLVGFGTVLGGIVFLSERPSFPGSWALLPCVGTALILYGTQAPNTLAAWALSAKPVVSVGQWSYSLYLWHWPLIVFASYYVLDLHSVPVVKMVAASASVPLAYLSWRFIERPFRGGNGFLNRQKLFRLAFIGSVAFSLLGVAGWALKGLPWRFSPAVVALDPERKYVNADCTAEKLCVVGYRAATPSFILWGDSHAHALNDGIGKVAERLHLSGYVFYNLGCRPFISDVVDSDCLTKNRAVADAIMVHRVRNVVLTAAWGAEANQLPPDILLAASKKLILAASAGGAKVFLMLDVPTAVDSVPETMAKNIILGTEPSGIASTTAQFDAQNAPMASAARALEREGLLIVLDPKPIFCGPENCRVSENWQPLYRDTNHLSNLGALIVANDLLAPVLRQ